MDSLDVVEPRTRVLLGRKFVVQAFLSEVLEHNFPALDSIVRGLDRAVLTAAKAISLYVFLIAAYAFPEYVVWCECNIRSEFILEWLEILNEINGSVRTRGHPQIILYFVAVLEGQDELRHDNELVLLCLSCVLQPLSYDCAVVLRNQH